MSLGAVVALPSSSSLSTLTVLDGWPMAFYIFGALGMAISITWFRNMVERPEDHPTISQKELSYIKKDIESLKKADVRNRLM